MNNFAKLNLVCSFIPYDVEFELLLLMKFQFIENNNNNNNNQIKHL